jgi:uncharacterized protein YggT (Ycf19 family)
MTEQQTTVERETVTGPVAPQARYAGTGPVDSYGRVTVTEQHVDTGPTAYDLVTRIVLVVFGVIQLLIALRIGLLLVDAREGNAVVDFILQVSAPLVAPFEGILRQDQVSSGGSTFDGAAVAALIGWTILEIVILAIVRIARPRTA